MEPEDEKILSEGCVDFYSFSYYMSSYVSASTGEIKSSIVLSMWISTTMALVPSEGAAKNLSIGIRK
jgi:beta-glucosidase/6-phospho-beta-glucosidase/beta-galactosidase